jgi:hypothetical protein
MIKIGITGTTTFENKVKIKKMIFKIKQELGESVLIVGIGDKQGADKYIRKFAIEFGCAYKEANLPHTSPTLYSMMNESFYNKEYNVKGYFLRNNVYSRYIDRLLVFDDQEGQCQKTSRLIQSAGKHNKKVVVIN